MKKYKEYPSGKERRFSHSHARTRRGCRNEGKKSGTGTRKRANIDGFFWFIRVLCELRNVTTHWHTLTHSTHTYTPGKDRVTPKSKSKWWNRKQHRIGTETKKKTLMSEPRKLIVEVCSPLSLLFKCMARCEGATKRQPTPILPPPSPLASFSPYFWISVLGASTKKEWKNCLPRPMKKHHVPAAGTFV